MDTWTIPPDPFAALGIERDSSAQAIKARYYQLARKYHPNRNYAGEESRNALAEHFHRIHEAWMLLREVEQRRRYIELIQLAELQDAVEAKHVESGFLGREESSSDEWSTSDAEEYDLTHLSTIRRARSPLGDERSDGEQGGQTAAGAGARAEAANGDLGPHGDKRRGRGHERAAGKAKAHHEREGSDAQSAAKRRRKLEKLKRRELEAFYEYKDAMLWKLESEMEAERRRDQYESAKARREKLENMPRETSARVRLAQQINRAVNLFKSQALPGKLVRKPTLKVQPQIMATSDGLRDSDFLTVSSPSTTRGLSSHWRGYSADISGDQTSSDDNGSSHRGARHGPLRSPSAIARRRRARQDAVAGAPRTATSPLAPQTNGNHATRVPDIPSFLIKRPTGFENTIDAIIHDSDSASYSSRSPSPQPHNDCQALILFPSETPGADSTGSHHRRTMSAPGQTLFNKNLGADSRSLYQGPMFEVKNVGQKLRFPNGIPRDHVHHLGLDEERELLKPPSDTGAHPQHLLERLTALDSSVASRFMVKKDIKDSFAFRLICNNREFVRQRHPSFIALSYRRRLLVKKHVDHYTLPLSKEMMQAVWDERNSDYEGLWVDQICIDQDSPLEQTISMSAMDEVYRNARLIVVVLDDLKLEQYEGEVLANHVREYEHLSYVAADKRFRRHQPPYLETHEDLFKVLQKILTSSWFRRAWCRHEMRLAKEHVFLLPCQAAGSYTQPVLRMTSPCIAHLLALATEVPFSADIELLKPALHAFFRDRTREILPGSTDPDASTHHGNFTTVVAEVFGMEAGGDPRLPIEQREADARRDKVSIILNTMECGLALQPHLRTSLLGLTKEDCYYSLLLLALAARDPGALCSVGKPLRLPRLESVRQQKSMYSWLFEPTNVDSGLNNYKTLDRLPANAHLHMGVSHGEHYVELDLKFLAPTRMSPPTEHPDIFTLAKTFVDTCEKHKHGRHRKRYLITDAKANESFGSMRDVYVETLACVFACGPDWMGEVCHRYGVSRFKQDLEPACWLMVALRNMNGTWPKANWTKNAAGFIMDFVNFLVIRGMPQRQLREPAAWRPIWVATPSGGKVLTFRPPGEDVRGVVPTALLDADYVHLARLWMVAPRENESSWTLLGKSVIFSDDLGLAQINYEGEMVRRRQKVFGRM